MDPYFAVAYFQMGVSYFVVNDMEAARQAFDYAYQVWPFTMTDAAGLIIYIYIINRNCVAIQL